MRKLASFALAFAAAVFLSCSLLSLRWLAPLGMFCALGGSAACFLRARWSKRAALLLLGLSAGFLWFRGWTVLFLSPADELTDSAAETSAVVLDFPEESSYGIRVEVRTGPGAGVRTLLYAGADCAGLEPGDTVTFSARFRSADYLRGQEVTWYTSKGVFLLAYAEDEVLSFHPDRVPLWTFPARWAKALRESIAAVFPEDTAGLTASVLLGGRDALSDWDGAMLTRSGLSHMVAVSGLHVGILAQGLLALCRRRRRLAACLTIPVLILFALMTGGSPGTVRAVIMQTFLLLAPILGREGDGPTSLSAALLFLLLLNPYAAASVSLQFSFAAVAGILLISERLQKRLKPLYTQENRPKPVNSALLALCAVFSTTLGALLFTTPLSAYYFGSVSLAGVPANLLALWAVSALFLLGFPAALAGLFLPALGKTLALAASLPARWILWVARSLGSLPFAAVTLDAVYYRLWLCALCLIVGAVLLFGRKHLRPVLPVCAGVLTLCAAIFLTHSFYAAAPLTVSVLDVGQGSSTAIVSQGRTALVDCGGNNMDNAGDTAADWFQSLGLSRLDLLVLTHFDSDHFNGVEELFRRMDVSAVAIPDTDDPYGRRADLLAWAEEEGARVYPVTELSGARLGEAELTLYPPLGRGTTNEEGLSLLCSLGDYDVLITGDADSAIEAMLVKYFDLPDIELLVAGHHGSHFSTSEAFLAALTPETAVISTGYNTYGHPAPETLERLDAAGVQVFRTDLQGTVTTVIHQGG